MRNEPPIPTDADEQAALWAARLDGGPLSESDAARLQEWTEANPDNEARLEKYQELNSEMRRTVPRLVRSGQVTLPRRAVSSRARPAVWLAWGSVAAAVLFGANLLYRQREHVERSTPVARRESLALKDGTTVDLNARTRLSARIRDEDRSVRLLEGEAFLSVARDPRRPFTVETAAGTVRVIGTAFNVRAESAERLEVTVVEGSVRVVLGSADYVLLPNEQFYLSGNVLGKRALRPNDVEAIVAWREGRVIFHGTALAQALERFSNYHGLRMWADPAVANAPLGGAFRLDDLEGFLRDVQQALPVRVLRAGNAVRLVPAPVAVASFGKKPDIE